MTTKELSVALGITAQRINELARKGKIPKAGQAQWDLVAVREALGRSLDRSQTLKARLDETPAAHTSTDGPEPKRGTLLYEQWRLTREKADREELDRKVLEGTLLKADEVRRAVTGMIAASKSRMMTMPDELCDRLAAETDAVSCREMVAVKVHEALVMLAEWPGSA